jgi:hypothetical protein
MLIPFMAIFTQGFLNIPTPFIFVAYSLTITLGVWYCIEKNNITIPGFLLLLAPYFLYKYFIDFYYDEKSKGSFYLTFRENLFIIATFFGLIMIFNSTISERYLTILKRYIQTLIIIAPVVTLIQVFNPLFLIDTGTDTTNLEHINAIYFLRRSSLFGYEDPNALGFSYLSLAFSFVGISLLDKKKFTFFYLSLIGIVVILSNTRYIILGFLLVCLQLISAEKNKLLLALRFILITLICIIPFFYFLQFIGYDIDNFYDVRINDTTNNNARIVGFNAFLKVFPQNPILGIGDQKASSIVNELKGLAPIIHIGYLNHLTVYGLLGSVFLFGFWIGLFRRIYIRAKKTNYWPAVLALIFFFWANVSLVMYSIFFSGLLLNLILEKYYVTQVAGRKSALFNFKLKGNVNSL